MATYGELKKELKSDSVAPLYLLLGPEEYLARDLASRLIDIALGDAMRDFNFVELDTPTADPPTLLHELNAYPFGAPRRVVLIRDVGSLPAPSQEALCGALADLPDFIALILTSDRLDKRKALYKAIAGAGIVVDLGPLKPAEAKTWIREKMAEQGKKISHGLVENVFALTGSGLSDISNEIDNLVAYIGDRKAVEQADIDVLVASRQKQPIYRLTEHIAGRDFMNAWTVLRQLLADGEHELRILWHLDFMLKRMLRARALIEDGVRDEVVAKTLQIQPFLRHRFFQQVRSFSLDELTRMYRTIVEWDNKFKSTSRWHPDIDMELLVRELCVTREH
jgi:DNA polymerase-3 subunit delta